MSSSFIASLKRNLKLFWVLFKRDMWQRYAWLQWFLPFEAISLITGAATWFFYGKMFGVNAPILQNYGGDFLTYLILGIAFNAILQHSMGSIYQIILGLYRWSWSSQGVRLSMGEYISMAKIPTWVYILSNITWGYCQVFIRFAIYLLAGIFVFGMALQPSINYGGILLAMFFGMLACVGIGLISSSMVWHAGAWHGMEPIQWAIGLLAPLVSGVYFPSEVLPKSLQIISVLFPQTYALRASRQAAMGMGHSNLIHDYVVLATFAIISLVLGILLLKSSMEVARHKASLGS